MHAHWVRSEIRCVCGEHYTVTHLAEERYRHCRGRHCNAEFDLHTGGWRTTTKPHRRRQDVSLER